MRVHYTSAYEYIYYAITAQLQAPFYDHHKTERFQRMVTGGVCAARK